MDEMAIQEAIKKSGFETSNSIKEISDALSRFQGEVLNPENTVQNTFLKNKYAPLSEVLNTVRPILSKYGLSVIQSPGGDGKITTTITRLLHSSGEWIEIAPLNITPAKADAQGIGAAITYARRYQLSALLGISSENDDDGNSASKKKDKYQANAVQKTITEITIQRDALKKMGFTKEDISPVIESIFIKDGKGVANYTQITDLMTANKVLDALKKLGEDKNGAKQG